MYSVSAYGKMIADTARMDAYVRALRQAIKPGAVVIDLGCGPGVFALTACQSGARRVYAIEPDNIIQVGRDAAREHGYGDRIEFIQQMSTEVTLPERADVIVSDLRGVLPWFQHHLPSIIDARSRFLAPRGTLIPNRDTIWAAVVEVPEKYAALVSPWIGNGFKLNSARSLAVNMWSKYRFRPENLLGQPACWHQLDYGQVEEPNVCEEISLTATRRGVAHGLALWFDAELIDGVEFSNAPGGEELIYGNAFYPFTEPVGVDVDDRIDVRLEARLIGDDYVWRWDTHVPSQGISFKQSTLLGVPLSVSELRKRVGQ